MPRGSTKALQISVRSLDEAVAALERVDEIQVEIDPLMREATDLKKAVTEFVVKKRIDVVQLDGHYYRHIQRYSRTWDSNALYKLVRGLKVKVKGKSTPLWQLLTRRVPDPEAINQAVALRWVRMEDIEDAFVEKPQAPFLQKFQGDAEDEE